MTAAYAEDDEMAQAPDGSVRLAQEHEAAQIIEEVEDDSQDHSDAIDDDD